MKNIVISFICVFALCACEEEEPEKVFDVPMEDVNSLWKLEPNKNIGPSLDLVIESVPNDGNIYFCHYLLFKKDGTGCIYSSLAGDLSYLENQNKHFSYTTEDCCHFDIVIDDKKERWTFAKENYYHDEYIFYSDTTEYGKKKYEVYFAEEVRSDSVIYDRNPELRGHEIKVPAQRVWTSKELKGKYIGMLFEVESVFNFQPNGKFTEKRKRSGEEGFIRTEHKGTFKVESGEIDKLVLTYSDGTETTTPIVITSRKNFILYSKGSHTNYSKI